MAMWKWRPSSWALSTNTIDLSLAPWQTVFAFAYAQTVHQSQGSEFDSVLFIDEWFRGDRHRWLYTDWGQRTHHHC